MYENTFDPLMAAIDAAAGVDVLGLHPAALLDRLDGLETAKRRLEAVQAVTICEIDTQDLASAAGFRTTAALLLFRLGWSPRTARARVRTADATTPVHSPTGTPTPAPYPRLAALMSTGTASGEQAPSRRRRRPGRADRW